MGFTSTWPRRCWRGAAPDGRPRKMRLGRWLLPTMNVLAKTRRLRGSWLDPFGHTAERKLERQLARDYETTIDELLAYADARQPCPRRRTGERAGAHPRLRSRETGERRDCEGAVAGAAPPLPRSCAGGTGRQADPGSGARSTRLKRAHRGFARRRWRVGSGGSKLDVPERNGGRHVDSLAPFQLPRPARRPLRGPPPRAQPQQRGNRAQPRMCCRTSSPSR